MPTPIAEAFVSIQPVFDKFDSGLKTSLQKAENSAQRAATQIETTFKSAASDSAQAFDALDSDIENTVKNLDLGAVEKSFDAAAADASESFQNLDGDIENTVKNLNLSKVKTSFDAAAAKAENAFNTIKSKIESSVQSLNLSRVKTQFDGAAEDAVRAFDNVEKDIERKVDDIDVNVDAEFEAAGTSGSASFLSGMKGLKGGVAAIGVAAGAALGAGFKSAIDRDNVAATLQAQFALTEDESRIAGRVAGQVYRSAWGESLEAAGAVTGALLQSFPDLDPLGGEIEDLAGQAFALQQAFGTDALELINSASIAVTSGLAEDGAEALDLLTGSFQNLSPVVRDEVVAATNEYAKSFAALGIDGPAAFGLLTKAGEQGVIGIDKAGDSIKEFTIRATDGSDTSVEAFAAIGLSGDDMANRFLAGGEVAGDAFSETVAGLLGIEDPAEQAATAIALFGTPLEDLGTDNIPDFLAAIGGAGDELGNFKGSAQGVADTLGGTVTAKFEAFKREAFGTFVDFLVENVIPAVDKVKVFFQEDLIPLMQELAEYWQPYLVAIQDVWDEVTGGIEEGGGALIELWPTIRDALKPLVDFFVNTLLPIAAQIQIAFIRLQVGLVKIFAGIVGSTITKIQELVTYFQITLFPAIKKVFDDILIALEPFVAYWKEIWPQIQTTVQNVWDAIVAVTTAALAVLEVVVTVAMVAIGAIIFVAVKVIQTLWETFGETIFNTVKVVFDSLLIFLDIALRVILETINLVTGLITLDWQQTWDAIKAILVLAWESIQLIVKIAIDAVYATIQLVLDAIGLYIDIALGLIKAAWELIWGGLSTFVSTTWDSISGFVVGGIEEIVGFVTELPGKIVTAVSGAFDSITDGFKTAINAVIRIWNNLSLPPFKVGGWEIGLGIKAPTITTPPIDLPDIKELANGGVVRSPTLALIGENGPEVVTPLNRQRRDFLPGDEGGGAVVSINQANFYDGTDADLVAQKTMLALSARRLTA